MPPKYWKEQEAGFVAKVLQETAALPRKRKKNYPKGASPPPPESESDEDTQRNPAPKPHKKSKSTATTTNANSPPPNHANDANEATEDSPSDVAVDTSGTSGIDGDTIEDSPSDVAVGTSGTSRVDEGLFDNSDVVEFDPIANRGPFDSDNNDDDDVEEEGGQAAPPSVANTSAIKDTSATPAVSADRSATEDTSATPADSAVESSLPAVPALPPVVPIAMDGTYSTAVDPPDDEDPPDEDGPTVNANSSRPQYLALPNTEKYCSAVDTEFGLWYDCWLCGSRGSDYRVKCRSHHTLSGWLQHKSTKMHINAETKEKEIKRISDKVKSKDPTLTDKERLALARMSKVASKVSTYFLKKPKAKDPPERLLTQRSPAVDQRSPAVASIAAAASIDLTQDQDLDEGTAKSPEKRRVVCEGVYVDYNKTDDPGGFAMNLSVYGRYRAVPSDSDYKVGMCGPYYNVFARECNLNGAQPRDTKYPAH